MKINHTVELENVECEMLKSAVDGEIDSDELIAYVQGRCQESYNRGVEEGERMKK